MSLEMIVVAVLFLSVLPLRKKVLMEGLFENENLGPKFFYLRKRYPLRFTIWRMFVFKNYCKRCVEEWRQNERVPLHSDLHYNCIAGVPVFALNIGRVWPRTGNSVRLVAWQNLFGLICLYHFERSDFQCNNLFDDIRNKVEIRTEQFAKELNLQNRPGQRRYNYSDSKRSAN